MIGRVEQVRDGDNGDVAHWSPDYDAPMTWRRCIEEGCDARVDPRDRNHRCAKHRYARSDADRIERVRAIVAANRERVTR